MLITQNRKIALIENGSWACVSGKLMTELGFSIEKILKVLENKVTLKSALNKESGRRIRKLSKKQLLIIWKNKGDGNYVG